MNEAIEEKAAEIYGKGSVTVEACLKIQVKGGVLYLSEEDAKDVFAQLGQALQKD